MIRTRAESVVIDNTIKATAKISRTAENSVSVNVYDSAANLYGGEYEFIPMVTAQIVACNQKKMLNDVTIKAIQTRETPDASGGVHFEILSGTMGDNYGI